MFQVNLDIEVEPRDRPSTKTPPWEGLQTKGLNPKILFSSRDEQQEILSKFGRWPAEYQLHLDFNSKFAGCFPWQGVSCSNFFWHCVFPPAGKPELPRQPGSSAFYDSELPPPAQTPDNSDGPEPESPGSTDTNANNFFQTLDWEGTVSFSYPYFKMNLIMINT